MAFFKTSFIRKITLFLVAAMLSVSAMAALDSNPVERLIKQNNGDAKTQVLIGAAYYHGQGVSQNSAKAFEWFEKAAKQGDSGAQVLLGVMYYSGEGVNQDYLQARQWYEKSSKQGVSMAQYNLGIMYENGKGVRQNKATAKEYFGKACDNGYQDGCDSYRILNQR